jgi:hypothetical protein
MLADGGAPEAAAPAAACAPAADPGAADKPLCLLVIGA